MLRMATMSPVSSSDFHFLLQASICPRSSVAFVCTLSSAAWGGYGNGTCQKGASQKLLEHGHLSMLSGLPLVG